VHHGHRSSTQSDLPHGADGHFLPWFTYPAIAYLEQLELSELDVFEFGSGAGTCYFGRRARSVVSVEDKEDWWDKIAHLAPDNTNVLRRPERGAYVDALKETRRLWDVIVVDGAWRRDCARAAVEHLSPTGFIILDNSDWYPKTAADLRQADLIEVDFTGLGPVNYFTWTTSFFLRRAAQLKPRGPLQPRGGIGSLAKRGEE
jgi:hypothetical protein